MVSLQSIEHTIFTIGVALGLIFLIFVVKIPVACTGCDSSVGIWYRCFSGGDGSNTCDTTTSGNFSNQVKEIVKELIDAGINLPKTIIDGVIYIKNKLVTLAVGIFDTIKSVLGDAYATMSMVYNDYIKGPVVSGYSFIKDNVVLPIIQGVTDYIVRPIQDLIEKIIGLKDTVFRAIKSAFQITRDIAVEVFDVTYGALIYGFDQIPYGLVSFVETIQDVLNTLKNGIIGRVPANNIPTGGMNRALYKTLSGIQTAVNTVTGGANYVIDPVVNGIIDVVNAVSFGKADISRIENAIPKTYFADNYKSWIPNPADLFWAGTKSVPMSDIVSGVDSVCPLLCKNNGYDTGKKNTNPGRTRECICTKDVTLTNNNALLSCSDMCSTVGGISMLPAEGKVCPVCTNEIIFPYNPFFLEYSFVIAFENTPFMTLKSKIKYSTTVTYTPDMLSTTLKTLLINDILFMLNSKNIDIFSQGVVPVSNLTFSTQSVTPTPTPPPTPTRPSPTPTPTPIPTMKTAFDATWFDIDYTNGLYSMAFTPVATTQLAAIASALALTSVGVDIILSFSTNSLLGQSYGFTSNAKISTNDTVTSTMTSTFTVPLTSSTVLAYLRTSGKSVDELVREKNAAGNFTDNVIIPYPAQPVVSTATPVNAFISYRGYNFYFLNGAYFVCMNNTFYKLNDQTIPISTDNGFKFIQLQSAMNCASPFSLKPYPNPNALKFTFMDNTYNFSEIIYFPTCPIIRATHSILMGADLEQALATGARPYRTKFFYLAACSTTSTTQNMADYYTQQSFLTTMAFLIWDKINTFANKSVYSTPPFLFSAANGKLTMQLTTTAYDAAGNLVYAPRDVAGNITNASGAPNATPAPVYDYSGNVLVQNNNPAVPLTGSLTLHLSQYPIIAYNFNTKKDITISSLATTPPSSYRLNLLDNSDTTLPAIKYGLGTTLDSTGNYKINPTGNYFEFHSASGTLNTPSYKPANNFIVYEFKDIYNEYAFSSTTILPIGTYTYEQIGMAFANALATDINSNTDNYYNFNAPTTITTDSNGNQTLSYSSSIGSTYSEANMNSTITTNFLKFNMSVDTQDRGLSSNQVCFPYMPVSTTVNPPNYIEPMATLFNTYFVIETNNSIIEQYEYYNLFGEYIEIEFETAFLMAEYEIVPDENSVYIRRDANGNNMINKSKIDIYEVWIVGSNDNKHWYKVDNQTSIESISNTPLINEQPLVYEFKIYRIIVTRMLNTPIPYPTSYIIKEINLYDSTFVKQRIVKYKTFNMSTSVSFPSDGVSLNTTLYKNTATISTFYQGTVSTPITVGIKAVVNNVVGAAKPAPPIISPSIITPNIIIPEVKPIVISNTLSLHNFKDIVDASGRTNHILISINSYYEKLCISDDGKILVLFDVSGNLYINRTNNIKGDKPNSSYTAPPITVVTYSDSVETKITPDTYFTATDGITTKPTTIAPTVSGDGNTIYIGHYGGISISKDVGNSVGSTFNTIPISVIGTNEQIFKIAASYDGNFVAACVCLVSDRGTPSWTDTTYYDKSKYKANKLILSNDGGGSWRRMPTFKVGKCSPIDVAVSSDGKIVIVLANDGSKGLIFVSNTYGYSFKNVAVDQTFNFKLNKTSISFQWYNTSSISISNDGKYILIPILYDDTSWILKSTDYGNTWSRIWPVINNNTNFFKSLPVTRCSASVCTKSFVTLREPTYTYPQTQSMATISCISNTGQYQFINMAYPTPITDTSDTDLLSIQVFGAGYNGNFHSFRISTNPITSSNPGIDLYKNSALQPSSGEISVDSFNKVRRMIENSTDLQSYYTYNRDDANICFQNPWDNRVSICGMPVQIINQPFVTKYNGNTKIYWGDNPSIYANPCNIEVPTGSNQTGIVCEDFATGSVNNVPNKMINFIYITMYPTNNASSVVLQSFDYGLNFYPFFTIKSTIKSIAISSDLVSLTFTDGKDNIFTVNTTIADVQVCPNRYTITQTNISSFINLTGRNTFNKGTSGPISQIVSALTIPDQLNVLTINPNSSLSKYFSDETKPLGWYNVNTLSTIDGGILPPYSYNSFTISDDGNFYTIISNINGIYNSFDRGKNWALSESTVNISWKVVKLSSTGQYGLACSTTNTLYRSTDYGKTWGTIKIQSPTINSIIIFNDVDLSITGQYQTVVTNGTGVYYSNNFGRTWLNTSWTSANWTLVKVSATGQEQIITGPNSPYVAFSSNYGNTFNTPDITRNRFTRNFKPVVLTQSASGRYITIATSDYGLYSSYDYAQTWYGYQTIGKACTNGSTIIEQNQKWNFGCMSNYATLLKNSNQIQTIEQDGKYQVFGANSAFYYSTTYGMAWSELVNNNAPLGFFRYVPDSSSETGNLNFRCIYTDGNIYDGNPFQFRYTLANNPFPDCFFSQITYTPSFVCNTQASNWNVRTAQLKIKFSDSRMSKTMKFALGIQSAADLDANKTASDLILFDNPGTYISDLPNTLFMFDPITPPFCGQDKEFKIPQAPNGISYYFLGSGYAVGNTLTLPLNPIMDNYGTTQLGMSYSTSLLISTVSYLLAQDIRSKTDGAAKPTFNFILNKTTKELRLAFSSSYTTPATLLIRTSQNLIMSNAWGSNGADLNLSSNSIISYSPSIIIPADDFINGMSSTTLNYRVINTNGYAYAGRLSSTPANGNKVEYFFETILTRLLINDINTKTSNKVNLSSSAFKFEVIKEFNANQDRVIKTFNFDFNDPLPNFVIILQFSKNPEWANVFGISEDISVFNVNRSLIEVTDDISDTEIFDTYKGWYYYFFNNNNYFYINPYLLKMSQLPSPSSEVLITSDELKTYYSFYTSTNKEDVYYYNGNNDYYVLVDENFVYLIDFVTTVNLGNGTPYSEGYIEKVSPDGFTYYNAPNEDWYVRGKTIDMFGVTVDAMIQVNRASLLLVTSDPNIVSYTYNSATTSLDGTVSFTTFNGTVTLPNGPFTPDLLASTLSELLTKDIQKQVPILNTAIRIQYEALTIDKQPTSQRYTFTIQNDIPFQLVLKCGTNPILASNLGVTSDIKINPIYPLVTTNLTSVVTNPLSIAYQFIDSNFNFTRYLTLPNATPTPEQLCIDLPLALINDIVTYTGYPYTPDMVIMTYDADEKKYTFTSYTTKGSTIVLKFNESIGPLYQRVIKPSTWASTLGCGPTFRFSKTPSVSPNAAVPVNPLELPYTFTDTASATTYASRLTFSNTAFNDAATGDSILQELSTLLFTDINSKQQQYGLLPNDLVITYDPSGKYYSFAVKSYAFTINLKFSASSLLGLNFGTLTDIAFSTLNPVLSSGPATMTYENYNTINMFIFQGLPAVFINTGTTSTSGLYGLVVGGQTCLNNLKCVERILIDPNISLASYGYILQPTGYYTKINAYVYDAKVQRLYLMLSTEVQKFYGSAEKNGFSVLTTCTLDSTGNCIPSSLNIIKLGNNTYVLLDKDVKTLLPFARDSVTEPSCPCHITANIIPTCNEVCSTKTSNSLNLPGGSNDPLLCANPFDDPLQTPCKCFYNGPVNVIIKPMQQYNPFRLLQSAFSSGGDSFFSGVTNAIKGFMLPLWNTVKQVTAFLSSITAMIVEAITTYANPSYVFNLLKNLAVLGAQEAMDQLRSFWDNTVKPGLEGLWAYRHVLIQKMKEGLSWVWENLKSALKALSVTISDIAVTVFGVVKSGVTYAWEKFSYYVGAILDTITPFIPVGPTIKFNVFLWVMIIIIGAFIGVDELLITLYDTLSMTFKNAKDSVEKVFGLFKSILTGT